jgi:hypothetical protein
MALGRVEAQVGQESGTIRVGEQQLPLYFADSWKPLISSNSRTEVGSNGRR